MKIKRREKAEEKEKEQLENSYRRLGNGMNGGMESFTKEQQENLKISEAFFESQLEEEKKKEAEKKEAAEKDAHTN